MARSLSQIRMARTKPSGPRKKKRSRRAAAHKAQEGTGCDGDDLVNEDNDDGNGFEIEVRFGGGLTPSQREVFNVASDRWAEVITGGDLPAAQLPSGEVIDAGTIRIDASGVQIDGPGGVLGQAGPTFLREGGLPVAGVMEFDTSDLLELEQNDSLLEVIIHEMGHVIGIGTLWNMNGLVSTPCRLVANPLFFGENAMREFGTLLGDDPLPVPIANTGGAGTRCGHWRESVFGHELMSGFLNRGDNPISRLTIGSLQDLNYAVNYAAADEYELPSFQSLMMMGIGDDTQNQRCCACGGGGRLGPPVRLDQ